MRILTALRLKIRDLLGISTLEKTMSDTQATTQATIDDLDLKEQANSLEIESIKTALSERDAAVLAKVKIVQDTLDSANIEIVRLNAEIATLGVPISTDALSGHLTETKTGLDALKTAIDTPLFAPDPVA